MTAFLLDASAVIGLIERRSAHVRGVLSRATVDPVVSVLTLGELAHGVHAAPDTAERARRQRTADRAARLPALGLAGRDIAECYGFVSASQRAGWIDRWLVAIASVGGLELVTQDVDIARLVDEVAWTPPWIAPVVALCPAG
jgi:predicted nucleic acid-binding protein